ncbi:MAG TPA: hypothetical protein DD738_08350 [Ruminiclostridium sp.]|nr:hypothetical protein [Ruminiclostridium sp.]
MADDLDKKLKQIADMFGVSDTSGLKNIVESMVPPDSGASRQSASPESNEAGPGNYPPPNYNRGLDMNLVSKAGEMINMFNHIQDSRITLLNSVQPFLGTQRQQRLGGAIQLLRIIAAVNSIAPSINRNNTKG